MEAIGLNPIRFDRIGLDPIRVNAIKLGVPGAASGSDRPYIDPEVLASLVAVCICDGKSNDDPDRAVIKNLVDPDNPFVISNAAYEGMSGCNGYPVVFGENKTYQRVGYGKATSTVMHLTNIYTTQALMFSYIKDAGKLTSLNKDYPSYKIKVSGIKKEFRLRYQYVKNADNTNISVFDIFNDGTYAIPKSVASDGSLTSDNVWVGFIFIGTVPESVDITIEVLPEYEGAFVTDGKDDLITSTKTVKEMLGGSNEVTVVSMIHQIGLNSTHDKAFTNYIEATNATTHYIRSQSKTAGKTGIYGYTYNSATQSLINNILGDKNDYEKSLANAANILSESSIFRVASGNSSTDTLSQVAWYWTFIANKVLTTDQINQVISYFNLDKHVKPDIIYDTIRQGITNENHASFNDELVDFSGNGHNMKIYNSAWNKESGINDEGAWQTDGVSDYGKVTGVPIYKDYTVAADRTVIGTLEQLDGGVSAKCTNYLNGSFVMDYKDSAFSFGGQKYLIHTLSRIISYQSKYISNGKEIVAGNSSDVSDLYVGKLGIDDRYSAIALYSYLLFPYSLSEFLLERQLKRYKLGTLYPGMIEWRPKVNINVPVVTPPTFSMNNGSDIITNGQYIPEGTEITIRIFTTTDSSVGGINEATAKINGVDIELSPSGNKTYYGGKFIVSSKQKIDITIDEYIRYENIVQPYPAIINLKQDGKTITWGDKLKVGSDIVFVGSANLLPELYTVSETRYNGVTLYPNTIIKVEKSMVFDNARTYLKANEPSCILSPNRLRIPNSSYKILGYIPDLTGKGNHGRLNNFAYTEESGANEDGSIRFDGTDDYITIPTLSHGGKQVLMKVNLQSYDRYLYDQRNNWSQYLAIVSAGKTIAYEYSNKGGKTYIDGILNEHIIDKDLLNITHNITAANANIGVQYAPNIGTSFARGNFAQMALFDFMLFPEISSEDEIKELNECVGIEGNVWGTLTQLINSTLISNETLIKNE